MTATAVRLTLTLPDKLVDAYARQASAEGKLVEDVMALRLERCVDHTSERPLYFDDSQRSMLERQLAVGMLSSADQAMRRIANFYELRINDPDGKRIATVTVEGEVMARLGPRAGITRQPVADYIRDIVARALAEHVNL